jgi:hypothetical protein
MMLKISGRIPIPILISTTFLFLYLFPSSRQVNQSPAACLVTHLQQCDKDTYRLFTWLDWCFGGMWA